MDDLLEKDARVLWSFWLACALAVTGGLAPLVLASGGPNRLAGAILPYLVAAGASAANALMWRRGKSLATALYFLAGVAIVYGMLLMFAVRAPAPIGGDRHLPRPARSMSGRVGAWVQHGRDHGLHARRPHGRALHP